MARKSTEVYWTVWAPALGILAVLCYYALFLYRHALNLPFADDIYDILQFLSGVVQSTSPAHTAELFFAQTNEHRTLASRLVYYLAFAAEGTVNFRTLVFLANLGLPLLLLQLYLPIRRSPYALLIALAAALMLFQLRIYELAFWSMAAFAYIYAFVYAFAALSCLQRVSPLRFVAALVFAALASFTFAAGQLVWLLGVASFLYQTFLLRRISLNYLLVWVASACLMTLIWHIDYETQTTIALILQTFAERPLHCLTYFLVLLGNGVSGESVVLAAGTGCVLLIFVAYASARVFARGKTGGVPDDNISLELFALLIVLFVFAMGLGRAPYTEVSYALSSRYSLPSVLLLATVMVLVTSRLSANTLNVKAYAVCLVVAATLWASSFHTYPPQLQKMLHGTVLYYNWYDSYWAFGQPPEKSRAVVKEAIALDVYKPPAHPYRWPTVAPDLETKAARLRRQQNKAKAH